MLLKKLCKKMTFVLLCFYLVACSTGPQLEPSLYDALGQYEGIENITHQLILNIAKDARVKSRYKGVNMSHFKKGMSDYVCALVKGPCEYKGDNMYIVHSGYQYTNTEFNAIVDNLILAMEQQKIPVTTQNRLLVLMAPSYKDIVYH
jgi:hemoglobin